MWCHQLGVVIRSSRRSFRRLFHSLRTSFRSIEHGKTRPGRGGGRGGPKLHPRPTDVSNRTLPALLRDA
ncbi:hypothetical protein L596_014521 [Steinernema carpocapsae]|uniref:Uncharacterized protein n=1 Tax=Steinernema carpocapsae TaxID=34508 RepID=A0A4U5NC61_STECR|nr:hypothetical protein L596_014521 [Steinernema carpocapsae]